MKLVYILAVVACFSCPEAGAQYANRIFVAGAGNIGFSHDKPEGMKKSEGFSHGLSLSRGRFMTENRANGFLASYSLRFAKGGNFMGPDEVLNPRGLSHAGLKVGRFWSAYKHLSDKFGVFGRLTAGVEQQFSRSRERTSGSDLGVEYVKENQYDINLGLSFGAGVYYKFSEKWWLTGEFEFSNPVSLGYFFNRATSYRGETALNVTKTNGFSYHLTPEISLPAVGLGLTYFIR